MRIVWDERKRLANIAKHGMDFSLLHLGFFASASVGHSRSGRMIAIGNLDGPTTVVFTRLGTEAFPVISMRPASRRERKLA